MVDAAEHPLRVRHDSKQAKPGAIGRRAVDHETFLAAMFDFNTLAPGHGVTHARLRTGRCNDHRIADLLGGRYKHGETSGVNSIIIGHQELHLRNAESRNTENLRAHTKRRFNTERSTSNAELRKLSRLRLT